MRRDLPLAQVPRDRSPWRNRTADESDQLTEIALRLSRVLRSGVPLETALIRVDDDMGHRHSTISVVARHVSIGRPITEVVSGWARHAESDAERLLVGAIEVGIGTGADLAGALDAVGEAIRDDIDHDRRRRILLTQNQMSAGVLVCLPLLFALISSLTRGVPYSGLVGVGLLLSGLGFDVLGLLWIRRLLARLS